MHYSQIAISRNKVFKKINCLKFNKLKRSILYRTILKSTSKTILSFLQYAVRETRQTNGMNRGLLELIPCRNIRVFVYFMWLRGIQKPTYLPWPFYQSLLYERVQWIIRGLRNIVFTITACYSNRIDLWYSIWKHLKNPNRMDCL